MSNKSQETASIVVLLGIFVLVSILALKPQNRVGLVPCEANAAFPFQPLGIDYRDFRLESYGRSAVNLNAGDTLCLALGWEAFALSHDDHQIMIRLLGADDRIGGEYIGRLIRSDNWADFSNHVEVYPLSISKDALLGRYNIEVVVNEESPIVIAVIYVVNQP